MRKIDEKRKNTPILSHDEKFGFGAAKFRFEKKSTSDWDMYLPLGLGMDILERVFLQFFDKKWKNLMTKTRKTHLQGCFGPDLNV